MTKKIRQAFAQQIKEGWYIHRETNHIIWRHPTGGTVTTAKTPSCPFANKKAIRYFNMENRKHGRA